LPIDVAVVNEKPPRPAGSFSNLLHPHNKEGEREEKKKEEISPNNRDPSHSMSALRSLRKRITLEEIRKTQLEQLAEKGLDASEEDKFFLYGSGPSRKNESDDSGKDNSINPVKSENTTATKSKTTNIVTSKWDSSSNSKAAARQMMMAPFDEIPHCVVIPDNVKKPGALYRVEDCFYNEDGEFLYRVPGMKF